MLPLDAHRECLMLIRLDLRLRSGYRWVSRVCLRECLGESAIEVDYQLGRRRCPSR